MGDVEKLEMNKYKASVELCKNEVDLLRAWFDDRAHWYKKAMSAMNSRVEDQKATRGPKTFIS